MRCMLPATVDAIHSIHVCIVQKGFFVAMQWKDNFWFLKEERKNKKQKKKRQRKKSLVCEEYFNNVKTL